VDPNSHPHQPTSPALRQSNIRHVLLDIEGTTCPVEFVGNVLFPFAANQLEGFVTENAYNPTISRLLQQVEEAWGEDQDPDAQALREQGGVIASPGNCLEQTQPSQAEFPTKPRAKAHRQIVAYMLWLIKKDKKLAPLKEIQGLIWEAGYQNGTLQGPLFADVAPALNRWRDAGLILSVYSSGSVKAQQLLYQYSNAGDLRPLFKDWFDTRIGPKLESTSYAHICERLASPPSQVLFISDSLAELQAAEKAGLSILYSDRNCQAPDRESAQRRFASIQSFASFDP
jgi:enolase-phosphatase E1